MRKPGILTIVLFLLTSCTLPAFPIASPPTATPVPASPTKTPITHTPTITPTQPTPTYTATPTLFGWKPTSTITGTPPTATSTQTPLPIFIDTPTPPILITPEESPGEGFKSFRLSGNRVFWGTCSPGTVTMEAEVLDADAVWRVYLFMHLRSTKKDDTTPWVGTTMANHRDGRFSYILRADLVDGRKYYLKAWVVFQLVAVDEQQKVIGRTRIYEQVLTIEPCP
ncbi:MAG: hypothetical protein AB1649_35080 [Chloroflexota bacterium]